MLLVLDRVLTENPASGISVKKYEHMFAYGSYGLSVQFLRFGIVSGIYLSCDVDVARIVSNILNNEFSVAARLRRVYRLKRYAAAGLVWHAGRVLIFSVGLQCQEPPD